MIKKDDIQTLGQLKNMLAKYRPTKERHSLKYDRLKSLRFIETSKVADELILIMTELEHSKSPTPFFDYTVQLIRLEQTLRAKESK